LPESSVAPYAHVAVVGTGAVGGFFGGMLARAGIDVTFIGRLATVEAIQRNGLWIDSAKLNERIRAKASTDLAAAHEAELLLFCVKTLGMESTANALKPHLAPGAIVLSLQNGVDNAERLRAVGLDAFAAVVYVAASMSEPARIKHDARGELAIGGEPSRRKDMERMAATFTRAGVPCQISANIQADLWNKFVFNCALNAVSAIAQVSYGAIASQQRGRDVATAAARETMAVARASGTQLPEDEVIQKLLAFAEKMGGVMSSTAQDIARRKHTEVDSLNGYVVKRAAELGIPAPVNQTLTALLKLIEAKF
jgi:2-dehydropantoate 2-reductase